MGNEQFNKYLKFARSARADGDDESAKKYYEMARMEDAENGEAQFFCKYYGLETCKNIEIASEFQSLCGIVVPAIKKVAVSQVSDEEKLEIIQVICKAFIPRTWSLNTYMNKLTVGSGSNRMRVLPNEHITKVSANGILTLYAMGDAINDYFSNDGEIKKFAVEAWKEGVLLQQKWYSLVNDKTLPEKYAAKIQKVEPNYIMPKKAGCISFADKR